ncbi:MAG: amidohydrolase family protein [Spirochaetes bacterium]|nr:amidohydrolase family protein [Spirochaetota bacterium]
MQINAAGRIVRLFKPGEKLPSGLTEIKPNGKAIVPAFTDSHAHFISKAVLAALAVNLARLENERIVPDSLEGVRQLLLAESSGGRKLLAAYGLCIAALKEKRLPVSAELDAWFPGREVIILSMDGHSSAYSSLALKKLKLEALAEDGILRAEAHEFNMGRVSGRILHGLKPAALAAGLAGAVREAIESGLVSIHCLEGTEDRFFDPGILLMKLLGGRLGPRLRLYLQYSAQVKAQRHQHSLHRLRAGGCLSWEMDGSVSSRSAAMDTAYLDGSGSGQLYRSPAEALAMARPYYSRGWQLAAHAIGPRGIESILWAYETLMDEAADQNNHLRLRIEHFEFPRPDQIERAGRRKLVLSVQPGFAWADARWIHSYETALPAEVRAAQCPLRALQDSGCRLSLSTDAPVQPLNPFYQIAGAVNHPNARHSLSIYESLRAYSYGGAYAAGEESDRGSLETGKFADFAVLDTDPFCIPTEQLHQVLVSETWHEGRPMQAPPETLPGFIRHILTSRPRKL